MEQGLRPGTLLHHGMYRIEKILGKGGFGITYLATDSGLNRQRAIKEFFPKDFCDRNENNSYVSLGNSNNSEFIIKLKKKFIKEARNIANLDQHHGIINIHAVFEENNTAYYVMDYIEGESLAAMVKRNGPLSQEKAIKYITKIGEALEYVHNHHINHLDVKPANIMIRERDDQPILIDFGLSKQYDTEGEETTTTPTGTSKGYAPHEQYIEGGLKEFTPQTDIYALAATLYFTLTGVRPPHSLELNDISKLKFPLNFPAKFIPGIKKAMSYNKKNRHGNINEFLASLNSNNENTEITFQSQQSSKSPHFITSNSQNTGQQDTINNKNIINNNNFNKYKKSLFLISAIIILGIILVISFVLKDNTQINNDLTDNEKIPKSSISDNNAKSYSSYASTNLEDYNTEINYKEDIKTNDEAENQKINKNTDHNTSNITREILSSPSVNYKGKICHFMSGYCDDEGVKYPIMVAFIEENNKISKVIYKNVTYGGKLKMNYSESGQTMVLSTRDKVSEFILKMNYKGNDLWEGWAEAGSKNMKTVLRGTTETFNF
ncbi:MAG: serine/threonine protein kinase [Muribaculaceae bacterium]|nr:serine/threonine protein kinase [Muribaculaceae bacterium]